MNNLATNEIPVAKKAAIQVAIQGYQGAFHHIASKHYFHNREVNVMPANTFADVVTLVEDGTVDAGLMAIENTLGGSLMMNFHLLNETDLKICGEISLKIQLQLMALPGTKIEEITEVRSHHMAIRQCRAFFKKHPHIRLVEDVDTALSAKDIHTGQLKNVGAIASSLAAELYDLEVIAPSIQTNNENSTRFLVLKKQDLLQTQAEKVSLCFATSHQVGSLLKVLNIFSAYNLNMTKIQSTPLIGKEFEYLFFVDFVVEGDVSWQQAISAIEPVTSYLKVLGAYNLGKRILE